MAAEPSVNAWEWMEKDEATWEAEWTQLGKGVDDQFAGVHTALQTACLYNYSAVVRWLLTTKSADPLCAPSGTEPPLFIAVGEGATESVDELLQFALRQKEAQSSSVLEAMLGQRTSPVDSVAHIGQAFAIYSAGDKTVLHVAVERGRIDIIRQLVERMNGEGLGAQLRILLQAGNTAGQTAIDLAVSKAVLAAQPAQAERYTALAVFLGALVDAIPSFPERQAAEEQQRQAEAGIRERARVAEKQALEARKREGLSRIRESYAPRHPEVYERIGLASSDWFDRIEKPVSDYGLWSAPALSPDYCSLLFQELLHYERAAKARPEAQLPLYQRHDGNLGSLECCGFQPVIDMIHEQLMMPVIRACFPHIEKVHTRHAFLTRNWLGRDEVFRKHKDAADITLNICLQKTDGVQGSTVAFFHSEDTDRVVLNYDHSLGHMVIHSGQEWHQTQELTGPQDGQRSSLIVWADIQA